MIKKNKKPIAIIAGTPFDTKLGAGLVKYLGVNPIEYPLAINPQEQTLLQLNSIKITAELCGILDQIKALDIKLVLIYCNSLAAAVPLEKVRLTYSELIILTPFDVYNDLCANLKSVGIITANSICAGSLERKLMGIYPQLNLVSVSNLSLVVAIESGVTSKILIEQFDLINLCLYFKKVGCNTIVLACTHFVTFYAQLQKELMALNTNIALFECSIMLLKELETHIKCN